MTRRYPEDEIQKAVVGHLRLRGVPGLVFWHTPNGMKLGGKLNRVGVPIQAARLKGLGVRAGVSDIIAVHNGRIFALELKAPGGRATESQMQFIADINAAGGYGGICEGLDPALKALEAWGLLRGTVA